MQDGEALLLYCLQICVIEKKKNNWDKLCSHVIIMTDIGLLDMYKHYTDGCSLSCMPSYHPETLPCILQYFLNVGWAVGSYFQKTQISLLFCFLLNKLSDILLTLNIVDIYLTEIELFGNREQNSFQTSLFKHL